ncbi:Homoserine kinase [Penicillium expansum]|uniref:Homoserine kinase n=1 Tax=Penicillium expansum TaxID=27334 RepID=A0A0A2K2C1_PENEN|nr:Homoserine kinase [Penicillium expansum]KGO36273.1 Homoserine kinase [Penicillium expansum]KGO45999.1 Homoserine kinase [Penicillium expansum]KGO61191.1 Homoserine kinase [Penicillium expansum]
MTSFVISIPCSSANIGPGFDVIGLALSLHLDLHVTVEAKPSSQLPFNCAITYEDQSKSVEQISLDPEVNLITRVALYVLRCHDQRAFPVETKVHIVNPIPLGRGLGSSGTAVVAGVMLGNEVERHPDNVAASLFGGFVGTYLNELKPEDVARKEIPLSEVLPAPAGGVDTGIRPPAPPMAIGHYRKFNWAPEIKAIAIIPDFVVPTANARNVLPETYSRADVVFNLQRAALLPAALGSSPPDPEMIFLAMQDKVHQPYRKTLIPGLTEILQFMTPATQPGLLGICLSGAGPTILALATDRFTEIADRIIAQFASNDISCQWKLLEPAQDGATVTYN